MSDRSALLRTLRERCPSLPVAENEPLSAHCSFRIGGPCDVMLFPAEEEIEEICRVLRAGGEKPLILGNGTNMLFPDEALHRVVLRVGERMAALRHVDDLTVSAGSGVTLARLAGSAASRSLTGLEFAQGIPGTLGGGVSMNAGAYGGELKDVITSVTYLDHGDLTVRTVNDGGFSYRHSRFSDTDDIILSAEVRLQPGDGDEIRERMRVLSEKRRSSQPLDMPSAGSTFKRPVGGYAAALIDEAGLKGFSVGGAAVSEKHAGFVVNRGGATCGDVLRLIDHIRDTVRSRTGIELEPEVRIIHD